MLLYIDGFFALLAVISTSVNVPLTVFARVLLVASVVGYVYGAWGIANQKKLGYQIAVAASFIPLVARTVATFSAGGPLQNLGFIFLGSGLIGALFEYGLIALLLHNQSREHVRIWFD